MNHQDELPLAKVSEVDEAKRQWLQGMRHPVDTVTEPEPAEIWLSSFASILRLGSWWRAPCFSRHPIRLQKRNCQFCWKALSRTETTQISLV